MKNPYKNTLIIGIIGTLFTLACTIVVCVISSIIWRHVVCICLLTICSFILGNTWIFYATVQRNIKMLRAYRELVSMIGGLKQNEENEKSDKEQP